MSNNLVFDKDATPLIIAGAPRSGTTFLTTAINTHAQALVTNELRIWSLINFVRLKSHTPSEVLPDHSLRRQLRVDMMLALTDFFHSFYRTRVDRTNLGCSSNIGDSVPHIIKAYGDKNPGYADPRYKGIVRTIAKNLRKAKYIHLVRDPRSCVASYRNTEVYSNDIGRCISTWKRHVSSMAALRDEYGPERVLEISYERLVSDEGPEVFRQIEDHLGLDHAEEPIRFLDRERQAPVPYRSPTTPPDKLGRKTYRDRLSHADIRHVENSCADLMTRYGYQPEPRRLIADFALARAQRAAQKVKTSK